MGNRIRDNPAHPQARSRWGCWYFPDTLDIRFTVSVEDSSIFRKCQFSSRRPSQAASRSRQSRAPRRRLSDATVQRNPQLYQRFHLALPCEDTLCRSRDWLQMAPSPLRAVRFLPVKEHPRCVARPDTASAFSSSLLRSAPCCIRNRRQLPMEVIHLSPPFSDPILSDMSFTGAGKGAR